MSSKPRKWKFRLRHVLEAIDRIERYTAGRTVEQLATDRQCLDAVVWNLTVIGDAVRHVPDSVVALYPNVPWSQMRGIRNRIVHEYDRLDTEIVWSVVRNELPPLVPVLQRIISEATE
jgi:uncharacterized protein with HEPN domain